MGHRTSRSSDPVARFSAGLLGRKSTLAVLGAIRDDDETVNATLLSDRLSMPVVEVSKELRALWSADLGLLVAVETPSRYAEFVPAKTSLWSAARQLRDEVETGLLEVPPSS